MLCILILMIFSKSDDRLSIYGPNNLVSVQLKRELGLDFKLEQLMKKYPKLEAIIKTAALTFDSKIVESDLDALIKDIGSPYNQPIFQSSTPLTPITDDLDKLNHVKSTLTNVCKSNRDLFNDLQQFKQYGKSFDEINDKIMKKSRLKKSKTVVDNWEQFKLKLKGKFAKESKLNMPTPHTSPKITTEPIETVLGHREDTVQHIESEQLPVLAEFKAHSPIQAAIPVHPPIQAMHPVESIVHSTIHPTTQAVRPLSQVHLPKPHSSPSAIQLRQQSTRSASNRLYMAVSALVLLMGGIGSYIYYHPDLIQTSTVHNFASTPFNK